LASPIERYRLERLACKRSSTRARAEGLLRRVILPTLSRLMAEAVTPADVPALHRAEREKAVEAG